jgi:sialate O-acetylesterase
MVLQQKSKCKIWGWSGPGDTITISIGWSGEVKFCVSDTSGRWKTNITTPAAGGPYRLVIEGDTAITLNNILIGEVWVCGGQSNMQMPFNGYISMPVNGSNDYIAHGHNKNIRLFTVERKFSVTPMENCNGEWVVSSPSEVANFSAVAYSFGKYIQNILEIPIGLINASWGDTPLEAWTGKNVLENDFEEIDVSALTTKEVSQKTPSVLFNSMINPIVNYSIRGVIFYHGTSNRDRPKQYGRLFPAMINNWRDSWGLGNFPFYFVQIAPYSYRFDKNTQSALLREAQLKTMLGTPNVGMVVTMDIGDSLSNHPPEKVMVGKRLAYWALANTYGFDGLQYSGPVFKSMTVKENKAILVFDFAELGLTSFDKKLKGFVISGENRRFYPAEAIIKGSSIEVWHNNVEKPVAVRYCWENYIRGTLFNTAGLPASSFRSDEWDE